MTHPTATPQAPRSVLRVGNCSGYFGDRPQALREMLEGGPLDVLTGDYLAELTMLILWKTGRRPGGVGYAPTFLAQMEDTLGLCLDRGTKVVVNAGGLDPRGLAEKLTELAARVGIGARIGWVEGDDLLTRLPELTAAGETFPHLEDGRPLAETGAPAVTANAYLGGWGIAEALRRGADVVVTGRVTDAALVVGPAAWAFDWATDDWDRLAGAVVAGHVLECGTQATGGNFSFFQEVPDLLHPGFPIAEIAPDGSSVITKHPGTGGAVTVETVTAQLLYEIASPAYANPDVVTHFDTAEVSQQGPDRVAITGVVGSPPPPTLKVCVNQEGGHRNTVAFGLTGLDVEAKADLALRGFLAHFDGGPTRPAVIDSRVVHGRPEDAVTNADAVSQLVITCKDADPAVVGRPVFDAANRLALASYPGTYLENAGRSARAFGVYVPTVVDRTRVPVSVYVDDEGPTTPPEPASTAPLSSTPPVDPPSPAVDGDLVETPLGALVGARSGDKGGNANIGVWTWSDVIHDWLSAHLTTGLLRELLPEAADLTVDRYPLPRLRALNFVVHDLLDDGVAATTRPDPQAKGLGEFLRSRTVHVPPSVLAAATRPAPGRAMG
ncbi:exopolyphosphatase [Geodermatophilus sp. Leaf369]|uniref:acyclic terpene utilization AtuA family protein n=1 Tax=Geodermatophilus sp. Leaf369 TaxID=1736354 RepID=UPI0006F67CD9|nr:acyclic terpene utilization AtuA family protein [Geodermatophilus sp. Leaf369]KQS54745.1 exopolyphosphatase [Geodermatophilus sp. Leaf369]